MALFNFWKKKRPVLGLALGGGGTRGFGHVGVIKALTESDIEFSYVAGTSAGSIVGALYCAGARGQDLVNIARDLDAKDIRRTLSLMPIDGSKLRSFMDAVIGDVTFDRLKVPFCAVAVDLRSGKQALLREGEVAKAVAASCAIPIIFKPVVWDDMHLVDGGLLNNIPSDAVRKMGADVVVSVDVSTKKLGTDSLKLFDIVGATIRIMGSANVEHGRAAADVLIKPDLSAFRSSSKEGFEQMIEIGYQAGLEAVPKIKALM